MWYVQEKWILHVVDIMRNPKEVEVDLEKDTENND